MMTIKMEKNFNPADEGNPHIKQNFNPTDNEI